MKYYTGAGDRGETSLFGGKRVSKDSLRVEAYGDVDELNSVIGTVRAFTRNQTVDSILEGIQEDLFVIGSDLAAEETTRNKIKNFPSVSSKDIEEMEKIIDDLSVQIKPINKFVLPTGTHAASLLHLARTVCRRAERRTISLSKKEKINQEIIRYLNRLSSLLYVLARLENQRDNVEEKIWQGMS